MNECIRTSCIPPVSGFPDNPELSGLLFKTQGISDLVHRRSQLYRCVLLYIGVHLYTPCTYCMYSARMYVHCTIPYMYVRVHLYTPCTYCMYSARVYVRCTIPYMYIRVHLYTPCTYCLYSAHVYVHCTIPYMYVRVHLYTPCTYVLFVQCTNVRMYVSHLM